jgi:hypothetical protein
MASVEQPCAPQPTLATSLQAAAVGDVCTAERGGSEAEATGERPKSKTANMPVGRLSECVALGHFL